MTRDQSIAGSAAWRSGWPAYALAVGMVAAATAVRWALDPLFGPVVQFITYYPAVAVVGIVAGGRAGLAATALSALLADVIFMEPRGSLVLLATRDWVALGWFAVSGALMSWMAELLGQARRRQGEAEERARGQAALRAREEQLRVALEAGRMGVWVWDARTGKVQTDALHRELWDIEGQEALVTVETILSRVHPEDRGVLVPKEGLAAMTGPLDLEFRVIRRNGEARWLQGWARPFRDAEGAVVGLVGVNFDITERKRAEEALRESEKRYRALFDNMTEGFGLHEIILDAEGKPCDFRFLELNAGWERLTGIPRERVVGKTMKEVWPDLDAYWLEIYGKVAMTGEPVHYENYNTPLGRWYETFAYSPKPREFALLFIDLTERKRAEEALRKSEARLAQAVQVGRLGTFEHDHVTGVVEASREMREIYGFGERERITLAKFIERMAPEDRERLVAEIRQGHDPGGDGRHEVEHRIEVPGRGTRWVSIRAQSFFEGEGAQRRVVRTIGAVRDITEQKAFEAELQRLVEERTGKLQELVGELEHFSYTITHDMRAPLRGMQGYAELMGKACTSCGEQDARRFLERITTSAARMDALITDALQYAKAVRQELELAPLDAGALLRGMLDSYPEFQPSRARIEIRGEIPLVMGNAAGLTQCFSNLLGNAVKFVKPGQVPEVLIWAELKRDEETRKRGDTERLRRGQAPAAGGWVRIWVEDKGIGIPEGMVPRVFDMFSRGHNTYGGTGIGLALVRKVVDRMGGLVGVESEEGKGSRFWVELESAERPVAR